MLYIDMDGRKTIKWHVGTETPTGAARDVVSIQADGDELEYISDKFGLVAAPPPKGQKVVIYYGEQARFIIGNL